MCCNIIYCYMKHRSLLVLLPILTLVILFFFLQNIKVDLVEASAGTLQWPSDGLEILFTDREEVIYNLVTDSLGNSYLLTGSNDTAYVDTNMYMFKVDPDGNQIWPGGKELGNNTTYDVSNMEMISDGDDGVIVSWTEKNKAVTPLVYTIYVQRIDKNGNCVWGTGCNDSVAVVSGTNYQAELTSDGNNGAFIAWRDSRSGSFQVYGQHISSTGVELWGAADKLVSTYSGQTLTLSADQSGGVFIGFYYYVDSTIRANVYVQRMDASGNQLWGATGKAAVNVIHDQKEPNILSDGNNGVYVSWTDWRVLGSSGASSIYMQRLNSNGDPYGGNWIQDGIPILANNSYSEK